MDKKITVVGAGFVGSTTAQRIVEKELADVILVDIVEGLAQGKALDIMESAPVEGFKAKITGSSDYALSENSDIVIITAGLSRKPGMSRDELQATNAKIVSQVVSDVAKVSPNAILILVTNPLDVMSYLAFKVSGFSPEKVMGMAGILDSARYRYFISQELGVVPSSVRAMVLGGHGDLMVPVSSHSKVNNQPIDELLSKEKIEAINQRTKKGGAEIVGLLKTGSAYYAPSSSVVEMVKAIIFDENKILPCSVYLSGQYGINDVYCGVPAKISASGVTEVVDISLSQEERLALVQSSEAVRANIQKIIP